MTTCQLINDSQYLGAVGLRSYWSKARAIEKGFCYGFNGMIPTTVGREGAAATKHVVHLSLMQLVCSCMVHG
jgi:hypothetical protein